MYRLLLATCCALVLLAPRPAAAQQPAGVPVPAPDTGTVVTIELRDGSKVTGYVIASGPDAITLRTLGGAELVLRPGDVAAVFRPRGMIVDREFWPADPSDSRLFLGPTARVPGHGHGYFGVYEVFIASGGAGVGERGMLSFGVSLIPGLEIDQQVFYIAPKVQLVSTPYLQLAGGAFWVRPPDGEDSGGMVFGSMTAGNAQAAISGTLGFPFVTGSGFADDALLMIGAEIRGTARVKLITENWFVPGEDGGILSAGVRLILEGATIEAAAATTTDGGFLPVVNFSLAW